MKIPPTKNMENKVLPKVQESLDSKMSNLKYYNFKHL